MKQKAKKAAKAVATPPTSPQRKWIEQGVRAQVLMNRFNDALGEMSRMSEAYRLSPTMENAVNAIDAWQVLMRVRSEVGAFPIDPLRDVSLAE